MSINKCQHRCLLLAQCYIRRRTLEDFEQLAVSEKIIPYQLDKHSLMIFIMLHFEFYGIFYQVFRILVTHPNLIADEISFSYSTSIIKYILNKDPTGSKDFFVTLIISEINDIYFFQLIQFSKWVFIGLSSQDFCMAK